MIFASYTLFLRGERGQDRPRGVRTRGPRGTVAETDGFTRFSRDDVVITHTSTLVGVGTHTWRTNGVLMRSSESEATSDVLQQGAGSNTVDN